MTASEVSGRSRRIASNWRLAIVRRRTSPRATRDAILGRLVKEGRPVVALARSASTARTLRELGAQVIEGDVLDPGRLVEGMQSCEVVYHVAGVNELCLPDPSPMFAVNVEGSRNVVEAAAEAAVRRVVYTSSAATLGEVKGTVGDEESPHRGSFLSEYERSKYEAERAIREAAGFGLGGA